MTAVTGILILIVILQIIQITSAPSKESQSSAASAEQRVELQKLLKQLDEAESEDATLRERLRENDQQIAMDTSPVSPAEMAGEVASDQQKLQALQNAVGTEKKRQQDRDVSVGLSQDEQNLETIEDQTRTAQEKLVNLDQEIKSKQKEIQSLENKLQNAVELQKRLYLIPDKAQTSKEAVVAVVSKSGIEFSRFNHPEDSKNVTDVNSDDAINQAIDSFSPADQYFVFYIKPSGVAVFDKIYQIAQQKGFDVGFDAIEESQEIVLAQPPGSDADVPVSQALPGSPQNGNETTQSPAGSSEPASADASTPPSTNSSPGSMVSSVDETNSTNAQPEPQTKSEPGSSRSITPPP
jgi:hypothetical protein